jgi:hypothetical protein
MREGRKPTARGVKQYKRHQALMARPDAQCSCHSCGMFRAYAQAHATELLIESLTLEAGE